jgi:hypothetical protein
MSVVMGDWQLVRVARVRVEAEDHQTQIDADLRRCQANTICGMHGFVHVGDDRLEFGKVNVPNRLCHPQQPGITHFQYFAYHGPATYPFSDMPSPKRSPAAPDK